MTAIDRTNSVSSAFSVKDSSTDSSICGNVMYYIMTSILSELNCSKSCFEDDKMALLKRSLQEQIKKIDSIDGKEKLLKFLKASMKDADPEMIAWLNGVEGSVACVKSKIEEILSQCKDKIIDLIYYLELAGGAPDHGKEEMVFGKWAQYYENYIYGEIDGRKSGFIDGKDWLDKIHSLRAALDKPGHSMKDIQDMQKLFGGLSGSLYSYLQEDKDICNFCSSSLGLALMMNNLTNTLISRSMQSDELLLQLYEKAKEDFKDELKNANFLAKTFGAFNNPIEF